MRTISFPEAINQSACIASFPLLRLIILGKLKQRRKRDSDSDGDSATSGEDEDSERLDSRPGEPQDSTTAEPSEAGETDDESGDSNDNARARATSVLPNARDQLSLFTTLRISRSKASPILYKGWFDASSSAPAAIS